MKRKAETNVEIQEEDAHARRKGYKYTRVFEHVDGNWPCHVYLQGNYGCLGSMSSLCIEHYHRCISQHLRSSSSSSSSDGDGPNPTSNSITRTTGGNVISTGREDDARFQGLMEPVADPHVSLSKPFVLRYHQIQPFLQELGRVLSGAQSFTVDVYSKYQLLPNQARTRLFLSLPVMETHPPRMGGGGVQGYGLLRLVHAVDSALILFQQPTYYNPPLFHISVASRPAVQTNAKAKIETVPAAVQVGGGGDVGGGTAVCRSEVSDGNLTNLDQDKEMEDSSTVHVVEESFNQILLESGFDIKLNKVVFQSMTLSAGKLTNKDANRRRREDEKKNRDLFSANHWQSMSVSMDETGADARNAAGADAGEKEEEEEIEPHWRDLIGYNQGTKSSTNTLSSGDTNSSALNMDTLHDTKECVNSSNNRVVDVGIVEAGALDMNHVSRTISKTMSIEFFEQLPNTIVPISTSTTLSSAPASASAGTALHNQRHHHHHHQQRISSMFTRYSSESESESGNSTDSGNDKESNGSTKVNQNNIESAIADSGSQQEAEGQDDKSKTTTTTRTITASNSTNENEQKQKLKQKNKKKSNGRADMMVRQASSNSSHASSALMERMASAEEPLAAGAGDMGRHVDVEAAAAEEEEALGHHRHELHGIGGGNSFDEYDSGFNHRGMSINAHSNNNNTSSSSSSSGGSMDDSLHDSNPHHHHHHHHHHGNGRSVRISSSSSMPSAYPHAEAEAEAGGVSLRGSQLPAVGMRLPFTAVECRIGNRLFRMDLHVATAPASAAMTQHHHNRTVAASSNSDIMTGYHQHNPVLMTGFYEV